MPDDAPVTTATDPADGGGSAMKLTLVQADVPIELNRRTPRRGAVGDIRLGANKGPSSTTQDPPCKKCNLTPCFCD